jgi:hypothetical protein
MPGAHVDGPVLYPLGLGNVWELLAREQSP